MLILKFHPRMKCLHVFFSFFHPGMKFHPCLSSRNEISSRQKRVNGKRHFTINRDDFIRGCNFTCKHPLRNFTKFTGKHLCQSLLFNKVAESLLKKGLQGRCFPVNLAKCPRTPFLQNTSGGLLRYLNKSSLNLSSSI